MLPRRPSPHVATALALALAAAVTAAVAGCAGAEEPSPPGTAATGPTASPAPPETTTAAGTGGAEFTHVTASVVDGEVETAAPRVEVARGATVHITVTSDVADELHVHGFGDPEIPLEPGRPGTVELVADEQGLFEVETHQGGLLLFQLLVR